MVDFRANVGLMRNDIETVEKDHEKLIENFVKYVDLFYRHYEVSPKMETFLNRFKKRLEEMRELILNCMEGLIQQEITVLENENPPTYLQLTFEETLESLQDICTELAETGEEYFILTSQAKRYVHYHCPEQSIKPFLKFTLDLIAQLVKTFLTMLVESIQSVIVDFEK